MTIADIKAALAAKAAASNVKPAHPVVAPPVHPAATTDQKPVPTEAEQPKPKTRTRKSASKKPTAAQTPAVQEVGAAAEAATMPEPPETQQTKATPKKTSTRKTASKKSENTAAFVIAEPIESIIAHHLKPGVDYNTIPGCGRKPALLKAGAEHLASIFGFYSTSKVVHRVEDFPKGLVLYEIATTIYDKTGNIIAVGLGSCNSRERRYQNNLAASLNTILKMAKKRSFVDAILTATSSSGVFTQDIDEIGRDLHEVSEQTAQEA